MKQIITLVTLISAFAAIPANAATPEQEKAFVESYKKALEAGDAKALNAFLSTDGAEADTVEFFKMMQTPEPGAKVVSVELVKPSRKRRPSSTSPWRCRTARPTKCRSSPSSSSW